MRKVESSGEQVLSAAVHENMRRPRKLAILWMAPLQAATTFTVWAITGGGETLRAWILTALLWLMKTSRVGSSSDLRARVARAPAAARAASAFAIGI